MTGPVYSSLPLYFQHFCSQDGEPLQSVRAHVIGRFGDLFVYWNDIQTVFADIDHLTDKHGDRVLFEVEEHNEIALL